MVTLNLLPWRDKQAQYEKQIMQRMMIGATIISLWILVIFDSWLWHEQNVTVAHIDSLKKEAAWRNGLAKMNATSLPAATAPEGNLLDFFKRLNQSNKNKVCFEQIKKTKEHIEFVGLANSAVGLTDFLRTSSLVSYFSEVKVLQLQAQEENQIKFNFIGKFHAL